MRRCEMCGRLLPEQTGRGRPRSFCDTTCKDTLKLVHLLNTQIDERIAPRFVEAGEAGAAKADMLRGELWRTANLLNAVKRRANAGSPWDIGGDYSS